MPNTSNSANQYTQEGVDEILTQLGGLQQYGGKFAESNHFQNANLGKALGVFGALLNTGAASFENNPMKAVMAQKVPGFAKGGEGGGLGGGGMGSLMETFLGSLAPLLGENGALVSEIPEDKDLYRQNGWSDVMTNSQAVAWALERGDITQSEAEWLMRWMDESSFQPYDWVR